MQIWEPIYKLNLERPISKLKHALGSSFIGLSNYVLILDTFCQVKNGSFLRKTMDYKWVILWKLGRFKFFNSNTSSYRVFHGLSEDHKIIEFEQEKLIL